MHPECDVLLSTYAFNVNLHRYTPVAPAPVFPVSVGGGGGDNGDCGDGNAVGGKAAQLARLICEMRDTIPGAKAG